MDKAYILNAVSGTDDDLREDLVTILPYLLPSSRVKLSDKNIKSSFDHFLLPESRITWGSLA